MDKLQVKGMYNSAVVRLKDIAEKKTIKNINETIRETFTNSAERGIISQSSFFDRTITNDNNISGYYIVAPDDFVYNPRISTFAPVGPINRNKIGRCGVVSPLYLVFSVHDVVPEYLEWYFKSNVWHKFMRENGNTGARSDRFSISDTEFFSMSISLPPINIQKTIARTLTVLDSKIASEKTEVEKLKALKFAMLDKMFPKDGETVPEIRFKGFTGEWKLRKICEIADRYDNLRIPVAASLRRKGNIPYYGANGIQDYVEGYTHSGEFVLVAEDGANDLKNYPVNYVNGYIWVNNHAHVLQGKLEIASNKFLQYAISKADIEYVLVGCGRVKLNAKVIMNLELMLPKYNEQCKIAEYFFDLDNLIALHQRKYEKLLDVKKAMLEKLIGGEN